MSTNIKRRVFLKGSLAAGTLGVAAGAGLLTPQAVIAAWNDASVRSEGLRNSRDSTFPRSASGSGCVSSRLASSSRDWISSLLKSARSLKAFTAVSLG